jgi:hypothetical protein
LGDSSMDSLGGYSIVVAIAVTIRIYTIITGAV